MHKSGQYNIKPVVNLNLPLAKEEEREVIREGGIDTTYTYVSTPI